MRLMGSLRLGGATLVSFEARKSRVAVVPVMVSPLVRMAEVEGAAEVETSLSQVA